MSCRIKGLTFLIFGIIESVQNKLSNFNNKDVCRLFSLMIIHFRSVEVYMATDLTADPCQFVKEI